MFNKIEEEQLRSLLRKNIDMHKRRVVNAADAVDPGDYVTLRQVNGTAGAAGSILIPSSVAAELEDHAETHEYNGTDELDLTNLHGLLADSQTPLEHVSTHETGTVTDDVYTGSSDELLVYGLFGALENPQEPLPHAGDHTLEGNDPIRIDELWEGTDITDLDSSTTRHGLLKKLSGTSTEYMDGSGAWSTPAGSGGGSVNYNNNFRLTLVTGDPNYAPRNLTPSSTDTALETCTFASAHGWVTGTIITPTSTNGGLTLGTNYYIHVVSTTAVSFHTTLANAIADASRVNLTANVTVVLIALGVSNTSIYLTPYKGNGIALYDGSAWSVTTSAEVSVAIGTLSSGTIYDVFAYLSSSVLTLELVAWASSTARTTAITLQNGVYVKSGTTTKRYVGSVCLDSTTTAIQTVQKQAVYNEDNKLPFPIAKYSVDTTWNYSSGTIRQANGNTAHQIEVLVGNLGVLMDLQLIHNGKTATTTSFHQAGIGEDSTTAMIRPSDGGLGGLLRFGLVANGEIEASYEMKHFIPLGKHVYSWNERGDASVAWTIQGADSAFRQYGLRGSLAI